MPIKQAASALGTMASSLAIHEGYTHFFLSIYLSAGDLEAYTVCACVRGTSYHHYSFVVISRFFNYPTCLINLTNTCYILLKTTTTTINVVLTFELSIVSVNPYIHLQRYLYFLVTPRREGHCSISRGR